MAPDSPVTNQPPAWNASTPNTLNIPETGGSYNFKPHATDPHIWDSVEISSKFALPAGYSLENGVLAVSAGAVSSPVTLVATDSEGLTDEHGCNITVATSGEFDMDADWLVRSRAPGVFYATNCTDLVKGCPGFTDVTNRIGRYENALEYQSDADLVVNSESRIPWPDGRGSCMRKETGGLSGGAFFMQRRGYRWRGANTDWNLKPYSYMPRNYTGGTESYPGIPGKRISAVDKIPLKYVEEDANLALGVSGENPDNLPCPRHFWWQVAMWLPEELLWGLPRHWLSKRDRDVYGCVGVLPEYHSNKFIFVDSYSNSQVAINSGGKTGILGSLFYNKNTNSFGVTRPHLGPNTVFKHHDIDTGSPPTGETTPTEIMLQRYGPSGEVLTDGYGMSGLLPLPGDYTERYQSLTKTEADEMGLTLPEANFWSAPWRGLPFGGWSSAARIQFPELNLDANGVWSGVLRPGRWHVVTILWSAQQEGAVNDDTLTQSTTGQPGKPMFVAMWAAPYGDPPKLLAYTHPGMDDAGPGFRPSRYNDRHNPSLQWQDAQTESYKNMGAHIVGPASNPRCMNPTLTQFDAVYFEDACRKVVGGATNLRYLIGAAVKTNWGRRRGMFDGSSMGFSSGAMLAYRVPNIPAEFEANHGQTPIIQTMPLLYEDGTQVYAPDKNNLMQPVHRVTVPPLPILPAVGDCFIVSNINNRWEGRVYDLPDVPELRLGYTEVIFSVDEIRFPGHLNTPLEKPWET